MEAVAARARLKEAAAGYFPEITVFGGLGFDDSNPTLSHGNWNWGISFLESLFDALRAPLRVRQALASLRAEVARLRKATLEVELDVRNALLDAKESVARQETAARAATLAAEAARLVAAEYGEGSANITRLLDSEIALTQARMRFSLATYRAAFSRISIAHSIGEYPAAPLEAEVEPERKETP